MRFPRSWRRRKRSLGRPTPADVSSGLVTVLFSIPEGMAYAAIAGFNPVAGLYAGMVPAIVGSLTSQSVLPDTGLDPKDAGNVATLTLMAGAVMLVMGVLPLEDRVLLVTTYWRTNLTLRQLARCSGYRNPRLTASSDTSGSASSACQHWRSETASYVCGSPAGRSVPTADVQSATVWAARDQNSC